MAQKKKFNIHIITERTNEKAREREREQHLDRCQKACLEAKEVKFLES